MASSETRSMEETVENYVDGAWRTPDGDDGQGS